jgi:hypothetical protein
MVKLRPLPCASYKTNSTKEKAASTRVECQRVQIDRASYQHHAQGPQESMAESREVFIEGPSQHVSGSWSVLCASLTGMAIGGPLLGMTGFSFLAAVTLLLVSSPLLLLFSPLLFCAALLLVGAVAAFSAAAAMAMTGVSTLGWAFREVRGRGDNVGTFGEGGVLERLAESGERLKKLGEDWAAHLQQKGVIKNAPDYDSWNRG